MSRKVSRKATNKTLAEDRAAILWERYRENDGRITCAEVLALTGKRASNLYASFQVQGVKGPPVWDTKAAIRKRQIDSLWAKSRQLGRDWLTVSEVAEATGIKTKEVSSLGKRYKGRIPEIRHERSQREPVFQDTSGMIRTDVGSPYTLKYWKAEPGPGPDQMTFFLL